MEKAVELSKLILEEKEKQKQQFPTKYADMDAYLVKSNMF